MQSIFMLFEQNTVDYILITIENKICDNNEYVTPMYLNSAFIFGNKFGAILGSYNV